jgi:hypothetical protein
MRTACLWQLAPLCLDAFLKAEPAMRQPKTSVRQSKGYLKSLRKHGDALPPYFK